MTLRGATGWLAGALAMAGCRSDGVVVLPDTSPPSVEPADAPPVVEASAASPTVPSPLPSSCVEFLSQLQCWLRASGNPARDVERAVGNTRARMERRADAAGACERAMVYRRELIGAAGCAHVAPEVDTLPASALAECAAGEFFFVRADGHVAGCRRECALASDCPAGTTCLSTGSAAGGPIDNRFCE